MAKFDELLEQTYQTLGETSLVPGKDEVSKVDKLKAAAARGNTDAEGDLDDLADEGDEEARKTNV